MSSRAVSNAAIFPSVQNSEDKLKIISPLDTLPINHSQPARTVNSKAIKYGASRFNSVVYESGQLVIWNSYSGCMNVFSGKQADGVREILNNGCNGELGGISKYLAKRGYLIGDDVDEYQRHQLRFGQSHYRNDILELILLSSEDCNFRCKYCYEDFPRGTMRPDVRAAVIKLLRNKISGLKYLSIGWFGGEPLYGFPAIEEIAPIAKQLAAEHQVNYTSHITTNGYLLDPQMAELLLSWSVRHFQITLDGTEQTHDQLRPLRTGEKTFQRIFSNLTALKKRPETFKVRIRINFNESVVSEMESLLDLVRREFGDDERFAVAFHPIGRWGGSNDDQLEVCGTRDGNVIKLEMLQKAMAKGLKVGGRLQDVSHYGSNVCYAARPYNFIIGADGKLLKCTVALDKEDYNIVGRLQTDGSFELDENKLALWTKPSFESDKICQSCSLLGSCHGLSCPLIRIEKGHRPCVSTPKPMLKQELAFAANHRVREATEVG